MIDLEAVHANPLLRQLHELPYPLYARLRAAGPVMWNEQMGLWMVTGYPAVLSALRDPRFSADRTRAEGYRPLTEEGRRPRSILVLDPPDHTRLRGLVQKAFTPRVVEGLRPRVQELVDGYLDRLEERGRIDLVTDLAYPLPVTVIADLLGVPSQDHEVFKGWSEAIAGSLDPVLRDMTGVVAAREELRAYLSGIIAQRRRQPRDDLISRLVEVEEQDDRLDGEELLQMLVLLLIAGHETTVNLIGNGVDALLEHPDQLALLRDRPELLEGAVEELLRYDSPVQLTARVVTEELELGSRRLRPGQLTMLLLGAANRDPAVFPDPDRLDLARTSNPHLAFGRGIHFCLGAPLARMEGQIAIGSLVRRFGRLRRDGEARRRPTITLRGFASLPVAA
jgi:cytochrome P450